MKEIRLILPIAVFVILSLILLDVPLSAQEWHPTGPSKDMKDWVQLKSGEWLRGNMDLFRDLKMEFDSDELDDLKLEWEDITAFRFPRQMTFVFEDQRIYTGSTSMKDGMIRINVEGGVVDVPREDLLSIIEGRPRERNFRRKFGPSSRNWKACWAGFRSRYNSNSWRRWCHPPRCRWWPWSAGGKWSPHKTRSSSPLPGRMGMVEEREILGRGVGKGWNRKVW